MKKNWSVKPVDQEKIARLEEELNIPSLLANSLVARGIDNLKLAQEFLNPNLDRDWADPLCIPGISEVVDVLQRAIENGKKTVVFGDFDVDGISASAVMLLGLRALGLEAVSYIPRRQDEGYGLSCEAIDKIMGISHIEGQAIEPLFGFVPELLVTVDCGITSKVETDYLLSLGVEVAVTDHHNPHDDIPDQVPVCNPKLDSNCPSGGLAGVGVALKVIQVLGQRMGKPQLWRGLIDLAALGTIADRMPLRGENRALVSAGLELIHQQPRPGIAASLHAAGDDPAECTAITLSFSIIPRLNAAGRMLDSTPSLKLLMCDNPVEAVALAQQLENINNERRQAEIELTDKAEEEANKIYEGRRVLVLAHENWHEGVKGIVASRLASKYGVPTILFTIEDGLAHGSGRSVGQIDLFSAISSMDDIIVKFGGHKYAAGVTVKVEDLPEFRSRLEQYFETFPPEDFVSSIEIDGVVDFDDLTLSQIQALNQMEPYGQDNPEPVFAMNNVFISSARAVGAKKNHLSFSITNGVEDATAIYFHCNETEDYITYEAPVDLVFVVQIDEWHGRRQLKLKVRDMDASHIETRAHDESIHFVESLFEKAEELLPSSESKQRMVPQAQAAVQLDAIMEQREDKLQKQSELKDSQQNSQQEAQPLVQQDGKLEAQAQGQNAVWVLPVSEMEDFGSYDLIGEMAVALTGRAGVRLHQSQRLALEALCRGESTLAVMATGRGKSLIFYVFAAIQALARNKKSIFVYPLRALINDQAYHVGQSFSMLGLQVRTLTGETSHADRQKIYEEWASGETSVILTTPEFLELHTAQLAQDGNVGFIAIDEAHHVSTSSEVHRPVYTKLSFLREAFANATILAVTATAPTNVAADICNSLGITRVVTDKSIRPNITIDDRRLTGDRRTYLASIVSTKQKTVVYVNSRQMTIDIARMLRKRLPGMATSIAFYNAGMSRSARVTVENLFREGELTTIVATTAFGEGVNVPDIRHIVLYHLPFSELAYNQMSGRCGRDGAPAQVHLLFDSSDVAVNTALMKQYCPTREQLVLMYKAIRVLNDEHAGPVSGQQVLDACNAASLGANMSLISIRTGIAIFTELGLADVQGSGDDKTISIRTGTGKVDIASSVRYCEACEELAAFEEFSKKMLAQSADQLLMGINRPLLPQE